MPCARSLGDILSYDGKSTVFFFAPSITSTVGRGGAGGVTLTGLGFVSLAAGLGTLRRAEVGAAFTPAVEPIPGSGAIMARSPRRRLLLLAPEVCSSAW